LNALAVYAFGLEAQNDAPALRFERGQLLHPDQPLRVVRVDTGAVPVLRPHDQRRKARLVGQLHLRDGQRRQSVVRDAHHHLPLRLAPPTIAQRVDVVQSIQQGERLLAQPARKVADEDGHLHGLTRRGALNCGHIQHQKVLREQVAHAHPLRPEVEAILFGAAVVVVDAVVFPLDVGQLGVGVADEFVEAAQGVDRH
jgi:hypothetical protein